MIFVTVDGTAHDHASQGVPLRSLWEDGGRKGGTQNPRPELPDRRLEMLLLQKGLRERRISPGLCCILSLEFLTNIFVLSAYVQAFFNTTWEGGEMTSPQRR